MRERMRLKDNLKRDKTNVYTRNGDNEDLEREKHRRRFRQKNFTTRVHDE